MPRNECRKILLSLNTAFGATKLPQHKKKGSQAGFPFFVLKVEQNYPRKPVRNWSFHFNLNYDLTETETEINTALFPGVILSACEGPF